MELVHKGLPYVKKRLPKSIWKQEFRIINDPEGINDLYFNLYKNFSINNANANHNFFLFINNCYNSD